MADSLLCDRTATQLAVEVLYPDGTVMVWKYARQASNAISPRHERQEVTLPGLRRRQAP